jgi:hypothetical protein
MTNRIYIQRHPQTKAIVSSFTYGEECEQISTDDPEYVEYLKNFNRLAISWEEVRSKRSILLKDSDWTDLPNTPLTTKEAWLSYRQALRDIPTTFKTPEEVIWPEAPNK